MTPVDSFPQPFTPKLATADVVKLVEAGGTLLQSYAGEYELIFSRRNGRECSPNLCTANTGDESARLSDWFYQPLISQPLGLSATLHRRMVLQRAPASAVVWGFAATGATVTTSFAGKTSTAFNGARSSWTWTKPREPQPTSAASSTSTRLARRMHPKRARFSLQ